MQSYLAQFKFLQRSKAVGTLGWWWRVVGFHIISTTAVPHYTPLVSQAQWLAHATLYTTRTLPTIQGTRSVSTRDPTRHASSCAHAVTASLLVTHKNLLWQLNAAHDNLEFDWFISLQIAYTLGSCVYWEIPSVVADNALGRYQQPPRVYSQYTLATQGITYTCTCIYVLPSTYTVHVVGTCTMYIAAVISHPWYCTQILTNVLRAGGR